MYVALIAAGVGLYYAGFFDLLADMSEKLDKDSGASDLTKGLILAGWVVGIILVIALLTIPAAMARRFTGNLKRMMIIAIALGAAFSIAGLFLSYALDLPSGATIIIVSGVSLVVTLGILKIRRIRRVNAAAA